jgi:hypothetical protein
MQTKLVKPHFSLTLKQEQKNLIDFVMGELKELDISNLKLDPAFLKYLSELIENQVQQRSDDTTTDKPSKMEILVEILKRLFPTMPEAEIDASRNIVEFLLKNKLVKKVAMSKIMTFYLKKRFSLGCSA